jgi:hypothetical protein
VPTNKLTVKIFLGSFHSCCPSLPVRRSVVSRIQYVTILLTATIVRYRSTLVRYSSPPLSPRVAWKFQQPRAVSASMTSSQADEPDAIIALAKSVGYKQRRPMVSYTLFFEEVDPAYDMPPCLINVYYTTRSIMTHLNHTPTGRTNELWRSNAYDDLEELRAFFLNPRMHTGKGYRNAKKAVRGCVACGKMKTRTEFSRNQWAKGPDANKCIECLAAPAGGDVAELVNGLEGITLDTDVAELVNGLERVTLDTTRFPTLTLDMLQSHNDQTGSRGAAGATKEKLVRRQFNCPACPNHGRGDYVFFKKVPALKPIVKCPQCKKASRGRCHRLYPVPVEAEKGYGLFKCTRCGDKWGSSRAVANLGQACFSCAKKGGDRDIFVKPFRLEVPKKESYAGRGMRRVPKEPIGEDEADEREYGDADRQRNGSSAQVGDSSFELQPREDSMEGANGVVGASAPTRIPQGYRHKCAGCKSGVCKNRKIPKSEMHDVSDGNTVSTRGSVMTNSSIDKTDFVDRDEDFSAFDDGEWTDV